MGHTDAGGRADLSSWLGRTEERCDLVSPGVLARLHAVLDHPPGDPSPPTLWHWLFFRDAEPQHALGADGHPARGGFLPPVSLPRRMYAGFRLRHRRLPRGAQEVRRRSTVRAVEEKEGRAGPLVFVTVEHRVLDGEGELLVEEEDLVYTGGRPAAADAGAEPVPDAPLTRDLVADPTLLFRFSAVTFNGHRIHYDRPYATEVEGYPGLVVHGPLIAALLCELALGSGTDRLERVEFQARRPVFAGERLHLRGWPQTNGRSVELNAFREDGATAARAMGVW